MRLTTQGATALRPCPDIGARRSGVASSHECSKPAWWIDIRLCEQRSSPRRAACGSATEHSAAGRALLDDAQQRTPTLGRGFEIARLLSRFLAFRHLFAERFELRVVDLVKLHAKLEYDH